MTTTETQQILSRPRWTRKDVAQLIGCTVFQVRSNERRWGLVHCRIELNERVIWYRAKMAMEALKVRALIDCD